MRVWTISLLIATALSSVFACARANHTSQWPYKAPMLLVKNPTGEPLVISARDGIGRELVTATIKANGTQCFRWPFIHAIGYLMATEANGGADTLTTAAFQPWSADGWEWSGQVRPVSNAKVCR
jgi:hypothetical protein